MYKNYLCIHNNNNNNFFIMNNSKETKTETKSETKSECEHKIVQDLIDIDPDRSVTIFYCEHCYKTFDKLFVPKK